MINQTFVSKQVRHCAYNVRLWARSRNHLCCGKAVDSEINVGLVFVLQSVNNTENNSTQEEQCVSLGIFVLCFVDLFVLLSVRNAFNFSYKLPDVFVWFKKKIGFSRQILIEVFQYRISRKICSVRGDLLSAERQTLRL